MTKLATITSSIAGPILLLTIVTAGTESSTLLSRHLAPHQPSGHSSSSTQRHYAVAGNHFAFCSGTRSARESNSVSADIAKPGGALNDEHSGESGSQGGHHYVPPDHFSGDIPTSAPQTSSAAPTDSIAPTLCGKEKHSGEHRQTSSTTNTSTMKKNTVYTTHHGPTKEDSPRRRANPKTTAKTAESAPEPSRQPATRASENVETRPAAPSDRPRHQAHNVHARPRSVPARNESPQWIVPTQGRCTSGFGPRRSGFHEGQDIAAPVGTPILAASEGRVISSGRASGYGLWVRIKHEDGIVTTYGHNKRNRVKRGTQVYPGQKIAEVGNRGQSTGPHLHFQIEVEGTPVDPVRFYKRQDGSSLCS